MKNSLFAVNWLVKNKLKETLTRPCEKVVAISLRPKAITGKDEVWSHPWIGALAPCVGYAYKNNQIVEPLLHMSHCPETKITWRHDPNGT